jgi:hypothetical protein
MNSGEVVDSDGKVMKLSEKEKKAAAGAKLQKDAKSAAIYACHDENDFGQVHWTLDLLLQSTAAAKNLFR